MKRACDSFRVTLKGAFCLYCGVPADSKEHWPPVSAVGRNGAGFILPACIECNAIARDAFPFDLTRRIDHVQSTLAKRYRKLLKLPHWRPLQYLKMIGFKL